MFGFLDYRNSTGGECHMAGDEIKPQIKWYEVVAMLCLIFLFVDVGKWLYAALRISLDSSMWTIVSLDRWVPAMWILDPPIVLALELVVLVVCFVVVNAVFIKRIVRS
jgi:hypothetical protein